MLAGSPLMILHPLWSCSCVRCRLVVERRSPLLLLLLPGTFHPRAALLLPSMFSSEAAARVPADVPVQGAPSCFFAPLGMFPSGALGALLRMLQSGVVCRSALDAQVKAALSFTYSFPIFWPPALMVLLGP